MTWHNRIVKAAREILVMGLAKAEDLVRFQSLGVTGKIWFSIGIFVLGFVLLTAFVQIQSLITEGAVRSAADGLFPAAEQSQDIENAYDEMVKLYADATLTFDSLSLAKGHEAGKAVTAKLEKMASLPLPGTRAKKVKNLAAAMGKYASTAAFAYPKVLASSADTPEIQAKLKELKESTGALKKELHQLRESLTKELTSEMAGVGGRASRQRWLSLLLFALTLAGAGAIANETIRRGISEPILAVVEGLREAVAEASSASSRMAASGRQVATDAQEQAEFIERSSATLNELGAATQENAERAAEADRLMRKAASAVAEVGTAMEDLKASMDLVSSSSRQVSTVLKSIDEIAFHTNILALNAAIEAARAGDAGAGFSVVAEEVRSLAHRAAEAAQRSAGIVERTIVDVGRGGHLVAQAQTAFREVTATIGDGGKVVAEIAASCQEQARGVHEIGEAMLKIETVTHNNVEHARSTAEAASAMTSQVRSTRDHIGELIAVVGSRN